MSLHDPLSAIDLTDARILLLLRLFQSNGRISIPRLAEAVRPLPNAGLGGVKRLTTVSSGTQAL